MRGELRDKPDVRRIARAIIEMERARLEAEAAAEREVTEHLSADTESADG